jgi:hypothetical protein
MVGINFSQQTTNSVVEQYEFRIDALLKKIEFLEAQIEVSKEFFKYK